ncbi:MAG TPA: hypothetical protein VI455_09195 [Terriglobia bacterium]
MHRLARISSALLLGTVGMLPLAAADSTDSITIPAGTSLEVELTSTVSSKTNQTGDLFTGKVTEPIINHGEEVVPESSTVEGHITFIKPPGRAKGRAEMRLVLDSIKTPDGQRYMIAAALQGAKGPEGTTVKDEGTVEGPGKDTKKGAEEAGIGAAAGAGVGAIAAGGSGALYGAAIGAVVGVVHTLAKHHGDVVLDPGTDMSFLIPRTVTVAKSTTPEPMLVPNAH